MKLVTRNEVEEFIVKWHYSHKVNGVTSSYHFALYDNNSTIGCAMLGEPSAPHVCSLYGTKDKLVEIRRFCCIDKTLKNTESYFLSQILKWIKRNTKIQMVIAYADPSAGHMGTIYKASNFQFIKTTKKKRVIKWGNKTYHERSYSTKYKGVLKPYSLKIQKAIECGEANWLVTEGKYLYRYNF